MKSLGRIEKAISQSFQKLIAGGRWGSVA